MRAVDAQTSPAERVATSAQTAQDGPPATGSSAQQGRVWNAPPASSMADRHNQQATSVTLARHALCRSLLAHKQSSARVRLRRAARRCVCHGMGHEWPSLLQVRTERQVLAIAIAVAVAVMGVDCSPGRPPPSDPHCTPRRVV